jgi:Predicted transcriptional regulator, contains C-terminal CBS domains
MKLKNVMSTEIHAVSKGASVQETARVMEIFGHSFIPVMSEGRPVGTVTADELVSQVVAKGLDPTRTSVSEVMNREPLAVYEDELVEDVSVMMQKDGLQRLLVVSDDGTLRGIFHPFGPCDAVR